MIAKFRNIYILFISCAFSVLGTLASRDSNIIPLLPVPYLFTLLMLLFMAFLVEEPHIIVFENRLFYLIGFCILSAFINYDYKMVVSCFCVLLIYSLLLKISEESRVYLLIGTSLGQLIFLVRYGLVDSWNGHSVCTAIAFITIISIISYQTKISDLFFLVLCLISGAIVIYMSSRTSIISFFCSLVCIYITKEGKTSTRTAKLVLLFIIVGIILLCFRDQLSQILLHKWDNRGFKGASMLTGREDIWIKELISDWTLFGNGEKYFIETYNHNDAHNIFIQVLGRYGVFALVLFIFFVIDLFKKIRIIKDESKKYIIPILVAYFIIGIFENDLFIDCKMYIPSVIFLVTISSLSNCNHETYLGGKNEYKYIKGY